jgi:iron complex outermembrane recepter protein
MLQGHREDFTRFLTTPGAVARTFDGVALRTPTSGRYSSAFRCKQWVIVAGTLGALALGIGATYASASDNDELAEIVVTAQKREEPLSRVPLAVSALSGDQLDDRGYTSATDLLGAVANLGVVMNNGVPYFSIRGVVANDALPGADPAVAFHVNGIYLATHEDTGSEFYDVSRIEVLKGPQGTLFGRNALGGAINLITNLPSDHFEASEQVTAGNYDAVSTRTVLSGPVTSDLGVRLAVATDNHSGYSLNLFNGQHYDDQNALSVRGTVVFDPFEMLRFTTIADYHREHDGDYAIHMGGIVNPAYPLLGVQLGGSVPPAGPNGLTLDPRLLDDYSIPRNRRESRGISEEIKLQLNESVIIKSLSAFRSFSGFFGGNFQGTTYPFPSDYPGYNYVQFSRTQQFSEELQLIGTTAKLNWVTGLYFLNSRVDGGYSFGLNPAPMAFPLTTGGHVSKPAYAAYGQATYQVTDKLGATAGLRYSSETSSDDTAWTSAGVLLSGFGPCVNLPGQLCHQVASAHFTAVTPRFEVHYQWTDALMTYASASKGFKSGGFEIAALTPPFRPASVWTYETGLKIASADRNWASTFAAFHSDYTNMQVQEVSNGITQIVNAAQSKIDGLELELTARPLKPLTFVESFGYEDARYVHFTEQNPNYPFLGPNGLLNLSGHQLQYTSKFTNNIKVAYEVPVQRGSLRLSSEWNWRDKEYFSEFSDPFEEQSAYSLYSAFLRYTDASNKWYVEAFGKNLANSLIISQTSIGGCGCLNSQYEPPRTYGVVVDYKY